MRMALERSHTCVHSSMMTLGIWDGFPNTLLGTCSILSDRLTLTDLMLHRAECHTIRGIPARDEHWTFDPIKGCPMVRMGLMRWAEAEVGGVPAECKLCEP